MTPLQSGDPAPAFTLPDPDQQPLRLADFAGGRVIVYFFPAALTPGCSLEAVDFDAAMGDLDAAGYRVVGISPDTTEKLAAFRDRDQLGFPLLSDPGRTVLTAWGTFGEKKMYGKTVHGVIRSTFLVDALGKIEVAQYNVKAAHAATLIQKIIAGSA